MKVHLCLRVLFVNHQGKIKEENDYVCLNELNSDFLNFIPIYTFVNSRNDLDCNSM